ncbi:MAG: glutathione S-transferase N-terminal domain-containing protein [Myxococcales bacterium]|nr:glutathione S-transferase N-terminal domain-containing protein [Myxococcales bacterium]
MHTLYASPLTCSLAPHALLLEHDVPHEVRYVRRGPGRLAVDEALARLDPRRKVPTLVLPDGEVLGEMVVVLGYLDERYGPERTPVERRALTRWLSFLATELHKQVLAPAFDADTPAEAVEDARARLLPHVLEVCADAVRQRQTLLGGPPSAADAYLWWALILLEHRWRADVPAELAAWRRAVGDRPGWRRALDEERGLLRS